MFAVMASNIHWQWTPNPYLAGLIGAGLAFAVTAGVSQLLLWTRQKSGEQRGE